MKAIRLEDFGLVRLAPDMSGQIPLDAVTAQARAVRQVQAGINDVVQVADRYLNELAEVRDIGQWAEAREGLYKFEQEKLAEINRERDPNLRQEKWRQAVQEQLADYLPTGLSGRVQERVNRAKKELYESGQIYLTQSEKLTQLKEARESWERSVAEAVSCGDESRAVSRVKEGAGVFLKESETPAACEKVKQEAKFQQDIAKLHREPNSIQQMGIPDKKAEQITEDDIKLLLESSEYKKQLREKFAHEMLRMVSSGIHQREPWLGNAEKYGLISPEQYRRYSEARDKQERAYWQGKSLDRDLALYCRMAMILDEDSGGENDTNAVLELATSGLSKEDISSLMKRREAMLGVPQALRKEAARRAAYMYRNGAWGVPGSRQALEDWHDFQHRLMTTVTENPAQAEAAIEELFRKEKSIQDAAWVRYRDMNPLKQKN